MSMLVVAKFGYPVECCLRDAVSRAKDADPLAPVTVVGPSNYSNLSLRRRLGSGSLRLAGSEHDGLVNVRFMPLGRLAELLGAGPLAARGKRLLTDTIRSELVRMALEEAPGGFRSVAGHPSTASSLEATFRDMRETTEDGLGAIASQSGRAADVVQVFRAYQARADGYYDETDLFFSAATEVETGSAALDEMGHVIAYLPRDVSVATETLLRALAAKGLLAVILGVTGHAAADGPTGPIRERLSDFLDAEDTPTLPPPPAGHSLICAPDPEEEVRAVLRRVHEAVFAGRPLHRMAILFRSSRPYALLAHEQLEAAGIPHNGGGTRTLSQSLAGSTLLGLMGLGDSGFSRDEVIEWIRGAPILETEGGGPAPDAAWSRIARAAGIVKGPNQWIARLEHYALALRAAKERDAEVESPRVRQRDRDIHETERLQAFISDLAVQARPPIESTWQHLSDWARGALKRYLGDRRDPAIWSADEVEAEAKVHQALDDLRSLATVRPWTDIGTFRRALEDHLGAGSQPAGHFGDGVYLGSASSAFGVGFDEAYVLGMNEGAFPPRPREDPLLPDAERVRGGVRLRADELAGDRRDYLAVLAAIPHVTLLTSRSDARAGREQLPCPWYLETASALASAPIYSRDITELADRPWMDYIASFHFAMLHSPLPASGQEHDIASLLHDWCDGRDLTQNEVVSGVPSLRAGFNAVIARSGIGFSEWDGSLTADPGLLPFGLAPISPTSLQTWAKCPFQYLLSRILGVAETERPEDAMDIRGKDRGDVFHHALERFFASRLGTLRPDTEWTAADREEIYALALAASRTLELSGVGESLAWKVERIDLRRDLNGFLDQDQRLRKKYRLTPIAVELAIGSNAVAPVDTAVAGGRKVRFHGRIDRVDRAEDQTLWVWDYKSGRLAYAGSVEPDAVDHGKLLQLPIYALGAKAKFGDSAVVSKYWFIREPAATDKNLVGYAVTENRIDRFREVVSSITGGISQGVFPARPGPMGKDDYENCGFCPYGAVCDADRERVWFRKRKAPELAEYAELAEGHPR